VEDPGSSLKFGRFSERPWVSRDGTPRKNIDFDILKAKKEYM